MSIALLKDTELKQWLTDLKTRIHQSQIKAMVRVNDEMLRLYWDLGHDIVVRQMDVQWGSGFFTQLSKELKAEFPEMQGFSRRNLYNMKQFYLFYNQDNTIFQQLVGKLENGNPHQLGEKTENEILHQVGAQIQLPENKGNIILHQLGAKLENEILYSIFQIPWGHHVCIINKCKSIPEAVFYVQKTIKNGWSRADRYFGIYTFKVIARKLQTLIAFH